VNYDMIVSSRTPGTIAKTSLAVCLAELKNQTRLTQMIHFQGR
jgi:hypothetical protein